MILLKSIKIRLLFLSVLFLLCFSSISEAQEDKVSLEGEEIFKTTCNACHKFPGEGDMTGLGPDLKDVLTHDRFVDSADPTAAFIRYVKNPVEFGVKAMAPQPFDTDQIKSVLEYIQTYVPEETSGLSNEEIATEQGMSLNSILIIVVIILLALILALISIKNTLKKTQNQPTETVFESITNFSKSYWENSTAVLISAFFLFIILLYLIFHFFMGIGVVEGYQPEQPIKFSHKIHAGDNGIDCNYCHSSARTSKTAGIPSVNVCMNCHNAIDEGTTTGTTEIQKIYDAIENNMPIEWIRVHQLPDLTYFNHSQHVTVGGLECQQCHGDYKEKTVGQVAYHEELNEIQQNIDDGITFKHPTLTMGWCIDCHRQKEIDMESNEYYAKMHDKIKANTKYQNKKITPALIGGMECGKCHH